MTDIVYSYKLKCLDCGCYKYDILRYLGQPEPTMCPDNPSHSIEEGSVAIHYVKDLTVHDVRVKQTSLVSPDVARTQIAGCCIDIVEGDIISTNYDCFDIPVDVVCAYCYAYTAQKKDYVIMDMVVAGDSPIGVVTEEVSAGATQIKVNSTAFANLAPGYFAWFGGYEYSVSEKGDNNLLTLGSNLDYDVAVGDPVYNSGLVVGTVAQEASKGQNQVTVDAAAYAALSVSDNTRFEEDEHMVLSMENGGDTITLKTPLRYDLGVGASVRLRIRYGHKYWIVPEKVLDMGGVVADAAPLQPTMDIRGRYFHVTPAPADEVCLFWAVVRY